MTTVGLCPYGDRLRSSGTDEGDVSHVTDAKHRVDQADGSKPAVLASQGRAEAGQAGETGNACGFVARGWPSTEDVTNIHDVLASYRAALEKIEIGEFLQYLKQVPDGPRRRILRALNLRDTTRLNRGIATALVTRMKNRSSAASLVDATCTSVGTLFRNSAHDPAAWSALADGTGPGPLVLRGEQSGEVDLRAAEYLGGAPHTTGIDRLGLAHAVDRCGNPVMSLWFLSAYDQDAAAAYDLLRQDFPMIPAGPGRRLEDFDPDQWQDWHDSTDGADADPVDGHEVRTALDAAPTPANVPTAAVVDEDAAAPAAPQTNPGDDAPPSTSPLDGPTAAHDGLDPASIAALVDGLPWERAFALALEVRDALGEETAPDPETLAELSAFTTRARAAAAHLSALAGAPVGPGAAAMQAALSELSARTLNQEVLARVAAVAGPTQFEATLSRVRDLATQESLAAADQTLREGLVALHDLAVQCAARKEGAEVDFVALGTLDSSARAGLPTSVHPVILAANLGDLTFPATAPAQLPPDLVPAPAHETVTGAAAPVTTSDQVSAQEPASTPADDESGTGTPVDERTSADVGPLDEPVTALSPTHAVTEPKAGTSDPAAAPAAAGDTPTGHAVDAGPANDGPSNDAPSGSGDTPDANAHTDVSSRLPEPKPEPTDVAGGADMADLEALLLADLAAAPAPLRVEHPSTVDTAALSSPSDAPAASGPRDNASGAVAPAGAPDSSADVHPDYTEQWLLEASLLRNGRFGLAAHLHASPAHRAARELAAYQQHLTQPAGKLAAAFATSAGHITRDALSDDRAGQLLAWAAAVRAAIVAPASGASGVLADLGPCFTDTPALAAVGDAFALAAQSGAIALPEVAGALSTIGDAEVRAAAASEAARAAVNDAPRRKIKYTPANGVYMAWMDPTGPLGALLRVASADDATKAAPILATVAKLRGAGEGLIDSTFSAQRKRNRKDKIIGGARTTLISLWEEALDIAADWASSTQTAREASGRLREGNSRTSRPLESLRRALADVRDDALAELDQLSVSPEPSSPTAVDDAPGAGPDHARATLEAGAAAAVIAMLTAAFATADGRPPVGEEPAPGWPLNSDLLATDLPLEATTLAPLRTAEVAEERDGLVARISAVGQTPFDAEAAYRVRAERLEHQLTAALVDNLTRLAPEEATLLRARRDNDVADATAALVQRRDEVLASVRSHQREATVPMEVATTMLATVEAIRPTGRYDFSAGHRQLDDVASDLAGHHAQQVIAAREQIAATAGESAAVAKHAGLLTSMVDEGQVAGALEYLEQLTTTGRLPAPRREGHHFDRFFPAVLEHAAAHPTLLGDVAEALHGNSPARSVTGLETLAETGLSEQSEGARRVAAQALGAWQTMATNRRADVDTVLKSVLALAGFEYKSRGELGKPNQGRQWIRLTGVTAIGQALVPALGSQMSRGGSSLRVLVVHKATSPATVIEWLREERVEETVLVLHLSGSYTAAERRSLADAARGRPRPVTIVIDPAVMSYLAVQPQADRATLAALTLPFTAESPYQDRAGRTAPEMFYGRSRERESVMNLEGPSFVSGGRQLGKSALLWSAKETFDDGGHHRAVMTEIRVVGADADPEQLWPRLASVLHDADILPAPEPSATADAETVPAAIRDWLDADTDRRLLILLDEADLFLDADAAQNHFYNIDAIKRLMETTGRRVKFVLAGLHRVVRFESLANQPLAHLGKQITIGPLRAQAAYDLVTRPMNALGYRFADDHTGPARVLAFTNNVPSLLQLFGQALMRRLTSRAVAGGPPTLITDDDITAVIEDTDLAEQFRNKYLLTLRLDPRYLVIVYAVAYNALVEEADLGMTLPEIEDACRSWWPEGFGDVTVDHLRGLVTECCDLGVLAHDQGRYRMRTQTMLRLLGSLETVEETLVGASTNLLLPASNDTASYRAPMPHSAHRSPLTSRQLSEILSARGTTFVVAGSAGTGVSWVPNALKELEQQGASRGMRVQRASVSVTADQLRGAGARISRPTLYVIDGRGYSPRRLRELLVVCDEVAAAHHDLVVVIAADQTSSPVWAGSPSLVELTRVDAGGLRLWCDEVSAPFHTAEDQAVLHQATGGWPRLLTSAFDEAAGDSAETRLGALSEELAKVSRARLLVTEAGLDPQVEDPDASGPKPAGGSAAPAVTEAPWVLWAHFEAIASLIGSDVFAGAPLAELADAVAEEKVNTPHGATMTLAGAAQHVGFASTEDVLVALRACGALAIGPNGDVSAEPVLLQACVLSGLVATP